MKMSKLKEIGIVKTLALASIILLVSTNSLAEVTLNKEIYIQKGYPYEGLVNRSEQVTIVYSEIAQKINCHVEVSQNGQTWRGEERNTSLKKFTQKPLRVCLNRVDAKKLLANTF